MNQIMNNLRDYAKLTWASYFYFDFLFCFFVDCFVALRAPRNDEKIPRFYATNQTRNDYNEQF